MRNGKLFSLLSVLVLASILLAACGGTAATATQAPATQPPATAAPATQAPTQAPATSAPATTAPTSQGSGIFAADGYECPAANPKMEVTSKELNLFVWTEYIPQDMQECFEKVYNIKVNRDEYSANEEMYA